MQDIREDLKNSKGDYALSVGKAMIGSVPIVGSAASELLSLVISKPISKRRDEWMIKLYEELKTLEEVVNGFRVENLKYNEQFVTVVLNATQLAVRNHSEEKLLALKNACINTALKINTNEDKQLIFLKYVEELIPLDIKILYHFMNPKERCIEKSVNMSSYFMGSPLMFFYDCNKDGNIDSNLVTMRVDNLISKNLLNNFSYNASCTSDGMLSSRLSDLGKEFMEYITR